MDCPFDEHNCELRTCDEHRCVIEVLQDAGYEIHKKGEHSGEKETVATRLRVGESAGNVESGGDPSGVERDKETPLTQEELVKLRKHMKLWADCTALCTEICVKSCPHLKHLN